MSFESTRWTSNKGGGTNRAPFALGAAPTPLEQLDAQWDALMGDPARANKISIVAQRQIRDLYGKFAGATLSSDMTALQAQFNLALGYLNAEKKRLGIPVTDLVLQAAQVSSGATRITEAGVTRADPATLAALAGVGLLVAIFAFGRRSW